MSKLFVSLLATLVVVHTTLSDAPAQPAKVFRIGYVAGRSPATDTDLEPIRRALRQAGYVEGQNLVIEARFTEGKGERYPNLYADLVRLQVDLILVGGGDGTILPAMKATKTIPLVLTGRGPTLSSQVSLKALAVREATSPASQTLATNWAASG